MNRSIRRKWRNGNTTDIYKLIRDIYVIHTKEGESEWSIAFHLCTLRSGNHFHGKYLSFLHGVQFTNEYSEMCMHHKYKHDLSIHTANNQMGKRERNSSDLEIDDFFFCHRSHFYGFFFSFLSNSSFRTINTNYLQHKHNVIISHIHIQCK